MVADCDACGGCGCNTESGVCDDCGCAKVSAEGIFSNVADTGLVYSSVLHSPAGPTTAPGAAGFNWFLKAQPYLSEPQTDEVAVVLDSCTVYWFDHANGIYTPKFNVKAELSFDAAACEFRFSDCRGTVIRFSNQGVYKGQTSPGGKLTQTRFNLNGQVEEIYQDVTTGGTSVRNWTRFDYHESGPLQGSLKAMTSGRGDRSLRRARLEHYSADEEHGSLGDLKRVITETRRGADWAEQDASYYRYYRAGDAGGFEHGLRFALGGEAYRRLLADPQVTDPDLASDEQIAAYADTAYVYDSQQRATESATRGGLLSYSFDYGESGFSDDPNHWKYRVAVTQADGSVRTTYSNRSSSTWRPMAIIGPSTTNTTAKPGRFFTPIPRRSSASIKDRPISA